MSKRWSPCWSQFFRNTIEPNIHLKVRTTDLERAHEVLEELMSISCRMWIHPITCSLFTDTELLDIVANPMNGAISTLSCPRAPGGKRVPYLMRPIRQNEAATSPSIVPSKAVGRLPELVRRLFRRWAPEKQR